MTQVQAIAVPEANSPELDAEDEPGDHDIPGRRPVLDADVEPLIAVRVKEPRRIADGSKNALVVGEIEDSTSLRFGELNAHQGAPMAVFREFDLVHVGVRLKAG